MSEHLLFEKNKSSYKLFDFGPIYYINLDDQPERRTYMEDQFKYWEISNYTRISAYDGRQDDLGGILRGSYPESVTSGEIGCVTSHLKAIEYWYNNSDTEYAIIMEDDCDLSLAKYWNFTWKDFIIRAPYDWDVLQLAIICTGDIHVRLHKRFVNNFSTACYVITRHHAEKVIKAHCRNGKYKLNNGVKPRCVADDLIYNSGNTYSIPILLYQIDLGSTIHPEHVDIFHKQSYSAIKQYWESTGSTLNLDELMDYNPYAGRITNPVSQEKQNILNNLSTMNDITELKNLISVIVEKYMV
jgi:GR25 family glycosyltransferase involved in LPS biosynthesis